MMTRCCSYFSLKAELNRLTDAAASEAAHLDELRPQMLQSEQEGAAAMSAHANAQAQLTELEDSLQAKASLRDQIHSELKRLIADLRPLENAIEMDARDEQKLVQLHEQSCHQLKAIDDSIARALERKEALAVQFNTDDLLRQQCEQRERLLLDQLGERIRTEKQQRETRDSDRRALDETRSSLEQRLRDISAARALALEEAERLEKKAASTVELTNTVLTQRTQLDAALNEAELARHEVDSSLASADTRKAAFEAQILELEQAIRSSTRSQEELRRRLDSAAAASAQLQQDLMLELHKISAESRKKEDELMQFNVEAASKLRACQVCCAWSEALALGCFLCSLPRLICYTECRKI
jgi:chromosome segregation ATPase